MWFSQSAWRRAPRLSWVTAWSLGTDGAGFVAGVWLGITIIHGLVYFSNVRLIFMACLIPAAFAAMLMPFFVAPESDGIATRSSRRCAAWRCPARLSPPDPGRPAASSPNKSASPAWRAMELDYHGHDETRGAVMAKEGGGGSPWVTIAVAAIGAISAIGAAFIARGPATPAPQPFVAAPGATPASAPGPAPTSTVAEGAASPATAPADAAPAAPSTDWRQQVLGYLDTQHQPLVEAGYAKDAGTDDWVGLLKVGTPKVWEVQLVRGVDYQVVGVCDSDCKNVDMEVYDGTGATIGADTLVDDFPRAQFRPGQSGPHTVKVWLRDCNSADGTQSCVVAARLLRR